MSIEDLNCSTDTHQSYTVKFDSDEINTVLTQTASVVDDWMSKLYQDFGSALNNLIVGFDVEWRPNFHKNQENKVSVLQLCVGSRCLIVQLMYLDKIPKSLIDFLQNPSFTFVGVGINEDVEKILCDYELGVSNTLDLRVLAAQKLNKIELKKMGLRDLTEAVLGVNLVKPKKVTMSRWDAEYLTYDQVLYACLDVVVAFKMAKHLMAMKASK
ncbi:hypothetical protein MKW98_004732 [Papaver atlanticum]|uniref:3'-5' exonuclease domain-containing protein n=1 Tax=Papaver atlanticum TaxID=357466 RepID=A0AAD4XIU2_9MAGN|nr:hypothetical protein MKW98_004732 [Papaver atlanticum]